MFYSVNQMGQIMGYYVYPGVEILCKLFGLFFGGTCLSCIRSAATSDLLHSALKLGKWLVYVT